MSAASRRAAPALAHLGARDPTMAALSLWCRHRDDTGATRTAGDTIYYGPAFDHVALHDQIGLSAHHILHVALRHSNRLAAMRLRLGPAFDETLYALVADAMVNETLLAAEYVLPRPCPVLSDLLGIMGRRDDAALAVWDVDRLYMALAADAKVQKAAREYGEKKGFARDIIAADETAQPADPGEPDDLAAWRGRVIRALEAGRQAGTGIGKLGHRLAELAPPTIPWEQRLRRLALIALSEQPRLSWRRPAGRWLAAEASARNSARNSVRSNARSNGGNNGPATPPFQPGRVRQSRYPRIAIGLDTSSSITDLTLQLFASEIAGLSRRMQAECHVLSFDDQVHDTRRLSPGFDASAFGLQAIRRGGGTSYVDLIARIEALAPSIAVILTDLDGPFGPAPRTRIIWAAPKDAARTVPFGELLIIDSQ